MQKGDDGDGRIRSHYPGSEGSRCGSHGQAGQASNRLCGHCRVPAVHPDDLYNPQRTGRHQYNFSAVDLSFHGGVLPAEVPEEYREYIEDIRKSFQNLDGLIAGVENLEDGQMDASRVKSYFYALYFGEEQPSRRAQKAFVECFLRYEERIREVEEEDGSITEETYTVAIFLTDQEEICSNLKSLLGRTPTMEDRANAQRIYTMAVYGRVVPGSFEAGEAMGDGSFGALFAEATKYIGYPYVWGGSSLQPPLTAAGISAGSTHSPVSTTCQGQQRKESITSAPSCPVKGQGPVT